MLGFRSFCVQRRPQEAVIWWVYVWVYPNFEVGVFSAEGVYSMALADTGIKRAKPGERPYSMSDGGGLYLWVTPSGGKLWRWSYR